MSSEPMTCPLPAAAGRVAEERKTAEQHREPTGEALVQVAESAGLVGDTLGAIGDLLGTVGSAAANAAQGLGEAAPGLLAPGETAADAAGEAAGSILDLFG